MNMSHSLSNWLANIKSDDIDGGLAADFDGSLSGLGVELGASTYNMSEALLALPPVFKQENNCGRLKSSDQPKQQQQQSSNCKGMLQSPSQGTVFSNVVSRSLTLPLSKCPPVACSPPDLTASSIHSLSLPSLGQQPDVDHMNPEWVNLMTSMKLGEVDDGETRFQYVLIAPTSPATRMSEETLTYLNQGQSYEIKLKRLKEGNDPEEQFLKSIVRVVFHERRMQYMEKEQLDIWKLTRPGDRIVDIDIPLSRGLLDLKIEPHRLNCVEFVWDPSSEATSVFIKVHCISTEFTAKKHGGEKGVPFRIQVETYTHATDMPLLLHCASCQVKVFKPKGADRKNKTDREKIERRSDSEKNKYQPSFDVTVLTEIPLEQVHNYLELLHKQQDEDERRNRDSTQDNQASNNSFISNQSPNSGTTAPPTVPDTLEIPVSTTAEELLGISEAIVATCNSAKSANMSNTSQLMSSAGSSYGVAVSSRKRPSETCLSICMSASSPTQAAVQNEETLLPTANPEEVTTWLNLHRFQKYVDIFQNFSGSDLLRLYRDDLIQICGIPDGIRLFNSLQAKSVQPKLTIYICQELAGQIKNSTYSEFSTSWDQNQSSPLSSRSRSSTPSPTPCSSGKNDLSPSMSAATLTSFVNNSSPSFANLNLGSEKKGFENLSAFGTCPTASGSAKRPISEKDDENQFFPLLMFKKQRMQNLELASREVYHAIYLESLTERHLAEKLAGLYAILPSQILEILVHGSLGIHVLVTDLVVQNMRDPARFSIEAIEDEERPGCYRVILKTVEM